MDRLSYSTRSLLEEEERQVFDEKLYGTVPRVGGMILEERAPSVICCLYRACSELVPRIVFLVELIRRGRFSREVQVQGFENSSGNLGRETTSILETSSVVLSPLLILPLYSLSLSFPTFKTGLPSFSCFFCL